MKYVILSVNESIEYMGYLPLTCWSWRKIGWEPVLFYHRQNESDSLTPVEELIAKHASVETHFLKSIPGYRSETISQISRLYGTCVKDGFIMTADADMYALSDYWKHEIDEDKITVYGHDLTGFGDYPICYIAMNSANWANVMGIDGKDYNKFIKRDLDRWPQAKSNDFYTWWGVDQNHITSVLFPYKDKINFINRGQYSNGYAKGRIDRGAWTVDHEQLIDCHDHRDLFKRFYTKEIPQDQWDLYDKKWTEHCAMLDKVWPGEDFTWYFDFIQQYAKLVQ